MVDSTVDVATPRRDGEVIAYPVVASLAIPKGVLVITIDAHGYLTSTIADPSGNIKFQGVSVEACASQDASGNLKLPVWKKGIFEFAMASAAITDVGKAVYLSDNQTVKLTANSAKQVGTIVAYENADMVYVDIDRR